MKKNGVKIAIYGAGAMGTVLGAFLTESGVAVDLISRNEAHINALKTTGAHIVCKADGKEKRVKVNALFPDEMTEKYDVVFLMTKQRENKNTLAFLKDFLNEDGIVCTTQNGLPEISVSEALGTEKTYGAAVSFGATFLGGGSVELTSKMQAMSMTVGGYLNDNAKLPLLGEILSKVSAVCGNPEFFTATDNLAGARWSKLCINAAFSGLSVVTGLTFGEIAKKRKTKRLALAIIREGISVAQAQGITLTPMQGHDMEKLLGGNGFFDRMKASIVLPIAMRKHKRLVSGMLKDVEKGRKCEIDFIDGVIVSQGEKWGVETPVSRQVVEIVHGIENGLYEISYKNTDFFM